MKVLRTALFVTLLAVTGAQAKPVPESSMNSMYGFSSITTNSKSYAVKSSKRYSKHATNKSVGPRPGKWCGWYMRTLFGGGPEYNLARNWAKRGTPTGPQVGAVVVWPHHVGLITGKDANGRWIVKSGNDSNAVRERPRSVAGAIAFRVL